MSGLYYYHLSRGQIIHLMVRSQVICLLTYYMDKSPWCQLKYVFPSWCVLPWQKWSSETSIFSITDSSTRKKAHWFYSSNRDILHDGRECPLCCFLHSAGYDLRLWKMVAGYSFMIVTFSDQRSAMEKWPRDGSAHILSQRPLTMGSYRSQNLRVPNSRYS